MQAGICYGDNSQLGQGMFLAAIFSEEVVDAFDPAGGVTPLLNSEA